MTTPEKPKPWYDRSPTQADAYDRVMAMLSKDDRLLIIPIEAIPLTGLENLIGLRQPDWPTMPEQSSPVPLEPLD